MAQWLTKCMRAVVVVWFIGSAAVAEEDLFNDDDPFADEALFAEFDDNADTAITFDPLEGMNRAVFSFNEQADRWVLKPVAEAYDWAVPGPAKTGVSNFFNNLGEPLVIINDLLQGKFLQALSDTGRFLINSTLGIYGLFDVAKHLNLPAHKEDFGQTFGVWGVDEGPYLVLPFLGPSNVRDGAGLAVTLTNDVISQVDDTGATEKLRVGDAVDTRYKSLDASDALAEGALDPYAFMRDSYTQHRRLKVEE